jgi:hypothetical protein
MHDLLRIGDIGFAPDELPRLEPYLPAPVGLALGGANVGVVIDLRPRHRSSSSKTRGRVDQKALAGAMVGLVLLAGATYKAHSDQSSATKTSATAQAEVKKLRSQLYYQQQGPVSSGGAGSASAATLKADVKTVLGQDVAWTAIISAIGLKLPPGVILKQFSGTHTIPVVVPVAPAATAAGTGSTGSTPGAATSGATSGTGATPAGAQAPVTPVVDPNDLCAGLIAPSGTVSFTGQAASLTQVSALLDSLKNDTDLTVLWVGTAKASAVQGAPDGVEFTVSASLGSTARGHRLETLFKGAKCK